MAGGYALLTGDQKHAETELKRAETNFNSSGFAILNRNEIERIIKGSNGLLCLMYYFWDETTYTLTSNILENNFYKFKLNTSNDELKKLIYHLYLVF